MNSTLFPRTIVLATWLAMSCTTISFGQEAKQSNFSDQDQKQVIHVVELHHAHAEDVRKAIINLQLPVRVTSTNDNRILLRGSEKIIEYVMDAVIAQLDSPSANVTKTTTIIKLNNEPTKDLIAALYSTGSSPGLRLGLDKVSRTLAIHGDVESIRSIQSFLAKADAPRRSITLDFFFLRGMIGTSATHSPSKLPAALQAVVAPLEDNGFVDLTLLAPIRVATREGDSFQVESSMKINDEPDNHDLLMFSVQGFANSGTSEQAVSITMEARVRGLYEAGEQSHFEIETNLAAKSGDYTVLSAVPTSMGHGEAIVLVVRATQG